jgi:hypothetical protein
MNSKYNKTQPMIRNLQSYLPSLLGPNNKEENISYWFIRTISRSLKPFIFLCHQTADSNGGFRIKYQTKISITQVLNFLGEVKP